MMDGKERTVKVYMPHLFYGTALFKLLRHPRPHTLASPFPRTPHIVPPFCRTFRIWRRRGRRRRRSLSRTKAVRTRFRQTAQCSSPASSPKCPRGTASRSTCSTSAARPPRCWRAAPRMCAGGWRSRSPCWRHCREGYMENKTIQFQAISCWTGLYQGGIHTIVWLYFPLVGLLVLHGAHRTRDIRWSNRNPFL